MSRMLYVSNLPHSATEDSLMTRFAKCGTVTSVQIVRDPVTGQSRRFGFIEMATLDEAMTAVQRLNLSDYDGRLMSVNKAASVPPSKP